MARQLEIGQDERFAIPVGARASLCAVARVLPCTDYDPDLTNVHIRLDIKGSGIEYVAGDHIGIMWEASDILVRAALSQVEAAFGSAHSMDEIAELPVTLNAAWRQALRFKEPYA